VRDLAQIEDYRNQNIPEPPGVLNEHGITEWRRIHSDANILFVNPSILYAYCNEFGKYIFYEQELAKVGRVVKAPSGYPIVHPYEAMSKAALKAAMDTARRFGISAPQLQQKKKTFNLK
jgi:phage terminase small subunit